MFKNRLFLQIFFTAGLAATVAASVIFISVQVQYEKTLNEKARQLLERQMDYAALLAEEFLLRDASMLEGRLGQGFSANSMRLSIVDLSGKVVFDTGRPIEELDNHKSRPELLQAAASGRGEAERYSQSVDADLLYLAKRLDDANGKPFGFVRVASAVNLVSEEFSELANRLLMVFILTLAIVLFVSYLFSVKFYQPIGVITDYAKEIAEGNYQLRLPGIGQDQLGLLERSLNELARKTQDRVERIEENRSRLEAILSGLEEGVIALDKDERIAHINRSALTLFSVNDSVIGRKIWEVIRVAKIQNLLDAETAEAGQTITIGNQTLEMSTTKMRSDTGVQEGTILVFQDVTERHMLDKMRTDFVANASHELKTPLAAIKGIIETIIDDENMPADVARNFFNRILAQADRLNKIVQELMQLSRFENYRDQTSVHAAVDVSSTARQVHAGVQNTASENGVEVFLDLADIPVIAHGDREAIYQLISNLTENAIKYSHNGSSVQLRVQKSNDMVVVEVEDSGIGLSESDQQRVFERFYRVDAARSRKLGGTGLGLSIVKHIAESHGGSVHVKSKLGHGSTFTVRLPADV